MGTIKTSLNTKRKVIVNTAQFAEKKTFTSISQPCSMTLEELETELQQSVEDARLNKGITIEQAKMRHPVL